MKKWLTITMTALFLFAFMIDIGVSQDKFKYEGAKQCKMCHNSAAKGAQFKKWSEASHAKAFAAYFQKRPLSFVLQKRKALPIRRRVMIV